MMMTHDNTPDKALDLATCFQQIRDLVLNAARDGSAFHDFEQSLWHSLLRLGKAATALFLSEQGPGDLGPHITLPDGRVVPRLEDLHTRKLTCLFGTFTLKRCAYGKRQGQAIDFVPLDNRLQLPTGKFSYLLQDFNGLLATEQPFLQVAEELQHILNLQQYDDAVQRQCQHMAQQVEPYRNSQKTPPAQEEGSLLVRTADAKGVPMRCPADAPSIRSHEHKRGPKTGRKKQAIVAAVYTVEPLPRTPEQIVDLLFRDPAKDEPPVERAKRPTPCHKRVMARLNEYHDSQGVEHDGLAEVFDWMDKQLGQRNAKGNKTVINLFDGDERFPQAKKQGKTPGGVDILDLLHVTPRLWKVARLLAPRDNDQAEQQVRGWVLRVLQGKVTQVLADLKSQGQDKELTDHARKELDKACNYLEQRKGQMRYHRYLKAGYPIASGVIEGACRHYVKDRMERAGMSWKERGAQAMLELRSVSLNDTWEEFQAFYRNREVESLYPHRHLLEAVAWPMAV